MMRSSASTTPETGRRYASNAAVQRALKSVVKESGRVTPSRALIISTHADIERPTNVQRAHAVIHQTCCQWLEAEGRMGEDDVIRDSWDANAASWTNMIRNDRSESRRLVTDRAIVDAVMRLRG